MGKRIRDGDVHDDARAFVAWTLGLARQAKVANQIVHVRHLVRYELTTMEGRLQRTQMPVCESLSKISPSFGVGTG
jgi:hypothetical protein